jgi:hypothetical protein
MGRPISALRDGVVGFTDQDRHPIPLIAMRIAIEINQGLAIVTTTRSFRNAEAVPVEAVLTFPVPFDAVMTGLRAVIDGRALTARAQSKTQARESYEDALDRGKTAVLHEEALRGVHVLSVGQLGPGKSVDVIAETVTPLSMVDGVPFLRIPTTVGQIYGASPLLPSDDLKTGENALTSAELSIRADSGSPRLHNAPPLSQHVTTIPLDRAIEISVSGARFGVSEGYDAKGRRVGVSLSPAPRGEGKIDVAILVDRSGSTGAFLGDRGERTTVWDAMKSGLVDGLNQLLLSDRVSLFQFDNACQSLGSSTGAEATELLSRLQPPAGGTELGAAIETVGAAGSRDILVLTDGQTWASEVHAAASRGCRVSAILVGSASLDAMIGHLASITGGQVFYAEGRDVGPAVRSAIASMRSPAVQLEGSASQGQPTALSLVRGGVRIEATWETTPTDQSVDAIGRYSASLALPLLDEQRATKLAVGHDVCSHLTSLLLVDEDGDTSEGIPEMRQVPLAISAGENVTSRNVVVESLALGRRVFHEATAFEDMADRSLSASLELSQFALSLNCGGSTSFNRAFKAWTSTIGIEWDRLANALSTGDLSGLTDAQREAVLRLAQSKPVVDLAKALGVDPVRIAIALLAETDNSRTAQRLARRMLRNAPPFLLALAKSQAKLALSKEGGR